MIAPYPLRRPPPPVGLDFIGARERGRRARVVRNFRRGGSLWTAVTRILLVLAVSAIALTGAGPPAQAAVEGGWRLMVQRTDRFVTDTHRYAAWADFDSPALSLLDTATGRRRVIGKPAGCSLPTAFDDPPGVGALSWPYLVLACRQAPYGRVLDLRDGAAISLPGTDGAGGWQVGRRLGFAAGGCDPRRARPCLLVDLRTGEVLPRPGRDGPFDLNSPTASSVRLCSAVAGRYRRAVGRALIEGIFFSWDRRAFLGFQGTALRLSRCGEQVVVLDRRGSTQNPRVGGGWATWDTGLDLTFYDGFPMKFAGTVEAVRLRDLRRWSWRAPRLRTDACGSLTPRWPFGRADHTRSRLFWVATLDGEDQLTCDPDRVRVFWAGLP